MTDITTIGFPDAARRLGVPLRTLRRAIRAGKIPAPNQHGATAALTSEWLAQAEAAAKASPSPFSGAARQKVPAYARYEGTSAWTGDRKRVRSYAWLRAAAESSADAAG